MYTNTVHVDSIIILLIIKIILLIIKMPFSVPVNGHKLNDNVSTIVIHYCSVYKLNLT